jgi:predicted GNAT family N-acyltransferase
VSVTIRIADCAADRLACWRIRERVFIEEQRIAEDVERDGLDDIAWHLAAWDGDQAVGTVRVLGIDAEQRVVRPARGTIAKIGRMAVLPSDRRRGIGRRLLEAALDLARREGIERAELSAQEYVVPFYARAGFRIEGEAYEEASIPHRKMSREL